MFQPIHLLPKPRNPDYDDIPLYKERWEKGVGKEWYDKIIVKIEEGAGEDFLQWDYENDAGLHGLIGDQWDLKGIKIWKKEIDFPNGDSFEAIDFSYSEFWHSKFNNAVFGSTYFSFGKLYNFEFKNCLFHFSNWYGVKFEKVKFVNCTFVEYNSFTNCKFINCEFENCFIDKNIFYDCLFDANTVVKKLSRHSVDTVFKAKLEMKYLSEIYKGIKDSYLAGEVFDKYREYFYEQKANETRHIKTGIKKLLGFLQENITGYGVKYFRTFEFGLLVILLFSFIYIGAGNFIFESLLMSASAFATMGDIPTLPPYNYIYVTESLLGISLLALLVTVMANVWFSEK